MRRTWLQSACPLFLVVLLLAESGCTTVPSPGVAPLPGTSLPGTSATGLQPAETVMGTPTREYAPPNLSPGRPAAASQSPAVTAGTAAVSPALTLAVVPAGIQEVLLIPSDTVVAGQEVEVRASTILSPGNRIVIEVLPAAFGPTSKMASHPEGGTSGVVTVEKEPGGGNAWSFRFSTAGFPPGLYVVTIAGTEVKRYKGSSTLAILPAPQAGTLPTRAGATGTVTAAT